MPSTLARAVPFAEEFGGGVPCDPPADEYSDKKSGQGFANERTHYRVQDAQGADRVDRQAFTLWRVSNQQRFAGSRPAIRVD